MEYKNWCGALAGLVHDITPVHVCLASIPTWLIHPMASLDSNVLPGESYVVSDQPMTMPDHDHEAGMDIMDELFPKEELKEEDAPAPSLNDGNKDEDVPMDDLFGETEVMEEPGKATSTVGSVMADDDGLSDSERQRRRALEYEEPEEEPEGQVFEEIIEASVEIPKVPIPKSSNGEVRTILRVIWTQA